MLWSFMVNNNYYVLISGRKKIGPVNCDTLKTSRYCMCILAAGYYFQFRDVGVVVTIPDLLKVKFINILLQSDFSSGTATLHSTNISFL